MSRLIAYMGSDPERLSAALQDYRDLLVTNMDVPGPAQEPAAAPAGAHAPAEPLVSWGIGFYQGGEVLLQRRPRIQGGSIDLYDAIKELRTDTFLAQVRKGTTARAAKNENTPPFRFRSWIMVHQGQVPGAGFERMREEILQKMPDFLRRNIRGQTESEHLFHLYLAALHEAGRAQLEDANLPPDAALKALSQALSVLSDIARRVGVGDDLGPMQVAVTNGRSLTVLRRGATPMWLRRLGAVSDGGRTYEHFRGFLALSGPDTTPGPERGFEEVPVDHAVLFGRDLSARIVPL